MAVVATAFAWALIAPSAFAAHGDSSHASPTITQPYSCDTPIGTRSAVGRKGGKSGSYDDWTKPELLKRARELELEGRSKMGKQALVKALRNR